MGAFIGGGGKLMLQCFWKKLNTPMMTFQCGDKIYHAWTASPPTGCSQIPTTSIAPSLKIFLTSIYEFGVVPNQGTTAIHPSVNTNINDFLRYLNKQFAEMIFIGTLLGFFGALTIKPTTRLIQNVVKRMKI